MKKGILLGLSVAAGAAAGAITTLFLAPKKGSELRQDITSKVENVKTKAIEVKSAAVEFKNKVAPAKQEAEVHIEVQATEETEPVAVKDEVTNTK